MIVDLSVPIKDLDDKPIKMEDGKPLLLRSVLTRVLVTDLQGEADSEEKFGRFTLALEVKAAESQIDLTHDQCVMIKKRVGQMFTTMVVGRMYQILGK